MSCLVKQWLPHGEITETTMAEALYLEKRFFENMANAVANGIGQAL